MPWIRKNPHLVALLVVAVLVIASSALVALNAKSYHEKFAPVQQVVIPGDKIEPLDVTVLDETQKELETPATWSVNVLKQPPFVPARYALSGGVPKKAEEGEHWADPQTGKMIPDKWFIDNNLPVTDPTVPTQDQDRDGFTNADEFRVEPKTNPRDANSHPPYYSKLYLKQFIKIPFRLKFNSYDGDPKTAKPEEMSFQINTLEYRTPSQFLKIGDEVFNKKFKIIKFEYKVRDNPSIGGEEEVSELTLENNETKALVVLVLNKVIDSPDSFALFQYYWPQPALDIRVPKLGKFVLLPIKDQLYQLLDITENQASIKLPSGETKTIGPAPANAP